MTRWLLKALAWITIIIFPLGCASTQVITSDTHLSLTEKATLVTSTGAPISTRAVATVKDSIFAYDYLYDRVHRFHFSEVQMLVVNNHSKGAWYGFGGGAALGVAGGFLDQDEEMPMVAAFMGGIFFGIGGAMAGLSKGNTTTYLFDANQKIPTSLDPQK